MENLRNKYIEAIATSSDENALEAVRLAALGKKGEVSLKMRAKARQLRRTKLVAARCAAANFARRLWRHFAHGFAKLRSIF